MNAFTKNIREVTRLTRAGKLAEAMALLQGRAAAPTLDNPPSTRSSPWPAPPDLERALRGLGARFSGLDALRRGREKSPAKAPAAPQGARFEARSFSNAAGSRGYKIYIPSAYVGQPLPLVVMLHGCTQDPDDFAAGTGMNALAEEQNFLVAYPHQPASANLKKCWNWFNAADQRRGGGEPSLIAGIARQVIDDFSADPRRVYIAGLSAGGAAAAILAATYPDVFAAVGIHSGLACGAARDMASAFAAMGGKAPAPPPIEGPALPTIVFHGDADRTVNPVNAKQIIAQVSQDATLTEVVTHGETAAGVGFTRTVLRQPAGVAVIEQWQVHGAGHAWSGGNPSGSFTDPRGPDASREMMRFFLAHAKA